MNDPLIQRSVGLKHSRWKWLDELALAQDISTSQLIRDVMESVILTSVGPAAVVRGSSSGDLGHNERATESAFLGGASPSGSVA